MNRVENLVSLANQYQMPALAITDHGNLYGAIEFYRYATAHGIKPIIGCEVYVAPGSRFDKENTCGIPNASFHLILLAKDMKGYKNLIRLVSAGHLEGFYYRPRIDKELLRQHHEGLIALSACLKGEIPYRILEGKEKAARKALEEYIDIFGKENFYLELQDNKIEDQRRVNRELLSLAKRYNLSPVATGDCHYLKKEDARVHEILLCIQTNSNINNHQRFRFSTDEFYVKSPQEMMEAFNEIPEAITSTIEIAEQCNLEIQMGHPMLPEYEVPPGYTPESFLKKLAYEGLEERLKKEGPDRSIPRSVYEKRLEEELKIINSMGYAGYFLIVWDFVNFAKSRGIPVGPGRGSAAGSLVAYCLKIIDLNPLRYGLLFERFLNPERVSMPDIDIDFCMDRRDEVIQYVSEKYGSDHVAQIITFGTMAARGVIRDVGRSLDIPYGEVDRIARLIPEGPNVSLKEAIDGEPRLRELMEKDRKVKELIEYALALEGLTRHSSTHAAGIVISKDPLIEHVPLCKGSNGEIVTQFSMENIEKIGLVKFDFLGLRTLTVIDKTVHLINKNRSERERFDITSIPLDDPATYRLLSSGATMGIFQLESRGMRDILIKVKPDTFEDLIAILALFRPGPLGSGMVDDYIKRRRGLVPVEYEIPELEDILKETYGVIVYQEQVMKIANALAGFSLGEADLMRRAMGKKDPETLLKLKDRFIKGCMDHGIDEARASRLFDLIEYFAGYGFNKSHSAAYALISYQTAYLKTHYPVEYMAAMLTCDMGKMDKITAGIKECREMGIEVPPPDVNESDLDFTVAGNTIRFGLGAIKNVGEGAIQAILKARKRGKFTSIFDFCRRVDLKKVNRRTIESLIKSGAFDSLGARRSQLMEVLDRAMDMGSSYSKSREQVSIFDMEGSSFDDTMETLPDIPEWDEHILLKQEKEMIGFYITGHPLARYEEKIRKYTLTTTRDIYEIENGKDVLVCGMISAIRSLNTRKGDKMAYIKIEDMEGSVEVIVFPDIYKASLDLLVEEKAVMVKGTVDRNENNVKIKATLIQDLETLPEKTIRRVDIRLNSVGLSRDDLESLRKILESYRGSCPVYLHLISGRKEYVMEIDRNLRINPVQDLFSLIENKFGKDSISIN